MTARSQRTNDCPDCRLDISRRSFLQASAAGSLLALTPGLYAAPSASSDAETAVGRLFTSLSAEQKKTICFPFEHQLRQRISANWNITEPTISQDFYSDEQRAIITEIVKGVCSEDGYKRIVEQTDDDSGGIGEYSCAIFGNPQEGKFEWELTGRHLTLRADGNSVEKAAFGGPIVYGHGQEEPRHNLYHYQTQQTNKLFQALDPKQAEKALQAKAPRETDVVLRGSDAPFAGIGGKELSDDQKQLVKETLKVLLAPYREEDVQEVMAILEKIGGVDALHMAFYNQEGSDLDDDKQWDIWRIEGPRFVWHFRGAPHVHAYINISA